MIQAPGFPLISAIAILFVALAAQVFIVWLVWRVIRRWRQNRQAHRTRQAMARERQNLTNADTAQLAIQSIRDRHEAAHQALRALPASSTPEEALRVLRLHLPITSFSALTTDLTRLWEITSHPPYLAAMAGLAIEHLDEGLAAVSDFREILIQVFDSAPEDLLLELSKRLRQRADKLGPWMLAGGLDDVRRAANRRKAYTPDADAVAALTGIVDALQQRSVAQAVDFVSWSVARCEAEGEAADPHRLASRIAFECRPLMGEPLRIAQEAFRRHRGDPQWRAAALSFDAMVVDAYTVGSDAYEGALRDFDFEAALDRIRDGIGDYDVSVANAAGNAAADIVEAGYFRDNKALLTLQGGLDWAQNIHWPRPPGQQRLFDLLARTPAEPEREA